MTRDHDPAKVIAGLFADIAREAMTAIGELVDPDAPDGDDRKRCGPRSGGPGASRPDASGPAARTGDIVQTADGIAELPAGTVVHTRAPARGIDPDDVAIRRGEYWATAGRQAQLTHDALLAEFGVVRVLHVPSPSSPSS